jgi:hypothetical protein
MPADKTIGMAAGVGNNIGGRHDGTVSHLSAAKGIPLREMIAGRPRLK